MANNILTPLMITRKSLSILHQKLNFVGNVNRQYDDRFAQDGAKIGQLLNIRMPAKYTVRNGKTLSVQDHVDRSTPLRVDNQVGVDVEFSSVELTMDLDDFGERVLEPAMAQLAASIEYDCLARAITLTAYNSGATNAQVTYKSFQQGGANITKSLGPQSQRTTLMNPDSQVEFNDAVKGLYQSSENIKRQYREGLMGRTGGFDVYENTLLPAHTRGDATGGITNGSNQGVSATTNEWALTSTITLDTVAPATGTFKAGDIVTFAGVFDVHPETRQSTGKLKPFVVQADVTAAGGAADIEIMPAMIYGDGNAFQNCYIESGDTDGRSVTILGDADTAVGQNLQFHKDAFVFATADLIDVSKFGAWGSRAVQDGISMRLARQYDITQDDVPCRIDVLYGFAGLYPELASRLIHQQ